MKRNLKFVIAGLTFLAIGIVACNKEEMESPLASVNKTKDARGQQGLFFSDYMGTAHFLVFNGQGCDYGWAQQPGFVNAFDPTTGGILFALGDGQCDFPNFGSRLLMKRGTTPGTLGPVYYVIAPGSSGYHALKLQVRNVAGASPNDYNQHFHFANATSTWTWDPTATTYFSFQVVPYPPACKTPGN